MYIYTKNGFKRKYVYGGSGLFSSLFDFVKGIFSSTAGKVVSSTAKQLGEKALSAAGERALDLGKTAASNIGKAAVDKIVNKIITPSTLPVQPDIKLNNVLAKHDIQPFLNISSLIDGSGLMKSSY